jgi:hypothetical protein
MAASTAPSVKAALLTLLRADVSLSGVQIEYADPGAEIQQESVFYGRTIETEKPDSLGQRKQRESYDLEIYVYTAQDGNDPQTCEERGWALVARLETVVRANNGNNGALSAALTNAAGWVVMGSVEMTPFTHSGQRVCEALCRVHVEAVK